MRGVVFLGDAEATVKEFPDPEPGPGEVRVKMRAAGICGSDIHVYHMPKAQAEKRGDVIAGHEPSGVVDMLGHGVRNVKVGDRVSVYHYRGCGLCPQCLRGYMQWCREARGYGSPKLPGSMADYIITDERNCLPLPQELSFLDGAFIGCIASTSWSALSKLGTGANDTLAVWGLGPVGLSGVLLAKALGARVIGIGRREIRLSLAKELGADEVVDIDTEDVPLRLRELTGGGPDHAYETSGATRAQQEMVNCLPRAGKGVIVAAGSEPSVNLGALIGKQLTLMGSFVMPIFMYWDLAKLMVEKRIPFEKMVTHRFSIEDAPEALELFDSGECGKVMFVWD